MFNYGQYGLDILHQGKSVISGSEARNEGDESKWLIPRKIIVEENLSAFPSVSIEFSNLATFSSNSIISWNDLSIIVTKEAQSNVVLYKIDVAITNVILRDDKLIIKGVGGCTHQELTEYGTSYLGKSDLSSAIHNLGFTSGDRYSIVNNISSIADEEYFMINETRVQCLLRLLRGASNYGTFGITNNEIIMINLEDLGTKSSENSLKEFIVPNEYNLFTIDNVIKPISKDDISNLNQDIKFTFKDEGLELAELHDYFYLGKNIISRNTNKFINNYSKDLRFTNKFEKLATFTYRRIFEYTLGDIMSIKELERLPYEYAIVIGLIYELDQGSLTTKVLLGGINGY